MTRRWRAAALGALLSAAFGALCLQALWLEPASLRVARHDLTLPGWPAACDGLRVAVLSDLHVGSPWNGAERVPEIVAAVNAQAPDLVLLAGDLVVAHGMAFGARVPPGSAARGLAGLRAPLGTFAALGNHDGWWGAAEVRAGLEAANVGVLEDAAREVGRGGCRFAVVGISDLWTGEHDVALAFRDVRESAATLALVHNPDAFPLLPAGTTLAIAGHTHGGQVKLPLLGRMVLPTRLGERWAAGHVVEAGRHYFVTTGIGTSVFPIRFGVPPEIALLTLRREPRL